MREEPDGRVALSMKDVNQADGTEKTSLFNSFNSTRGTGGGVRIPELHSIHQGTAKRIQAFGAFVAVRPTETASVHLPYISAFFYIYILI